MFLIIVVVFVLWLTRFRGHPVRGESLDRICEALDERGMESKQGYLTNNSERGHVECVRYLLQTGTKPNEGQEKGYTPLLAASQFGHLEVADLLIKAGADVNFDSNGTPLCTALQNQRASLQLVSLLVDSGAKMTWRDANSALNCLGDATGRREKFNYLVERGILSQMTQEQKDNALVGLNWDEAENLILHGLDPNAAHDGGQTLLIRAVRYRECQVVQFLIAHGADISAKDVRGNGSLAMARQDQSVLATAQSSGKWFPDLPRATASNKAILRMLEMPSQAAGVSCP